MMVDPTVLMKGIEEDPSLLEELAALSGEGGGGSGGDAGLKSGLRLSRFGRGGGEWIRLNAQSIVFIRICV